MHAPSRRAAAGAVAALALTLAATSAASAADPIGLSLNDGDVIRGTTDVYANPAGTTLAVDGKAINTAPAASLPATLRFEGDGIQSGSQTLLNSVWVNGRLVSLITKDYMGMATAEVAIPAGYLKPGANTVTVRAGSSLSPTDLTRNHDDFTFRNVRLTTLGGTTLTDPSVPVGKVISIGDGYPGGNATEAQVTRSFTISVPDALATGVRGTLATETMADGPHVLRATDAGTTREVRFLTDNHGPEITATTPTDGEHVTSEYLRISATATDSVSSVASVTATLDGRRIPVPTSFPTDNIVAGTHTLVFTATDSAGNVTTRTITFTTPQPTVPRGAYDQGQVWHGPMAGPQGPTVAAAGDIACDAKSRVTPTACQHAAVADVIAGLKPAAVLTIADNQYDVGTLPAFLASYDKSWGRFLPITHPVVGNHEYAQADNPGGRADGYFDYFNGVGVQDGRAGDRDRGYYSYDIGRWHVVALNSECGVVACAPGSGQYAWLEQDLKAHHNRCTLAVWHKPLFTGTFRGGMYGNPGSRPLYELATRYGVDVILDGHDHNYQRFAPQDANGVARPDAPREFIVGTGGVGWHGQPDRVPNLEVAQSDTFGALALKLNPSGYEWRFVGVPGSGSGFTDSGSASCH